MTRVYDAVARLFGGAGFALLMLSLIVVPERQLRADPPGTVPVKCDNTCVKGTIAKDCKDPTGKCQPIAGSNATCTPCGQIAEVDQTSGNIIACKTSCGEITP